MFFGLEKHRTPSSLKESAYSYSPEIVSIYSNNFGGQYEHTLVSRDLHHDFDV